MQQRSGESSHRASDPEAEQHASVDVPSEHPEALCRPDEMRECYSSDSEFCAGLKGKRRREQTADAESRDSSHTAGEYRDRG
jgi:hypothetical protein